jgi:hypothetical protein
MIRQCPSCGTRLAADLDRLSARCPTCREPIAEPPRDPHTPAADGSCCAKHRNNGSVATCERCGNFICSICWTRWHGQVRCIDCVNSDLAGSARLPHEERAHFRQSLLGLIFGIAAWVFTIAALVLMVIGMAGISDDELSSPDPPMQRMMLVLLAMILLLFSPLPGILGVGQSAAAIRGQGNHMIMATLGLVLCGFHSGMILGLFMISLWQA